MAFQALYSWDTRYSQTGETSIPDGLLEFSWAGQESDRESTLEEKMLAFSCLLVTGTIENIARVDGIIQEHLQNWELKRLNRVDLAILRMSVYTLMFQNDIPPSVVIDEAVEISREFGTDDSYRFVNGVLDSIRKTLTGNCEPKHPESAVPK